MAIILIAGCKNKYEKLHDKILKNLTEFVKSEAPKDVTVDKIIINKIDTIGPRRVILIRNFFNSKRLERYQKLVECNINLYKANFGMYQMESQHSNNDALLDEANDAWKAAKLYVDSSRMTLKLDSLLKIEYINCKDSTTLKYYEVIFSIKAHKTNNESSDRDSCSVFFNTDLRVMQERNIK